MALAVRACATVTRAVHKPTRMASLMRVTITILMATSDANLNFFEFSFQFCVRHTLWGSQHPRRKQGTSTVNQVASVAGKPTVRHRSPTRPRQQINTLKLNRHELLKRGVRWTLT